MKRILIIWMDGGPAFLATVVTFGLVLAMAPKAWAWGRAGFEGYQGRAAPYQSSPQRYAGGGGGPMYFYPKKGQSPQQEQRDKAQCYTWAVQQSGFDPANPRVASGPPPAASVPQGGMFRGAAGGAAMGAATGALFGGMRRRRWAEQQQYEQNAYLEKRQNALDQGRNNFNRAFAVCMTGRGYTVGQ